MTHSDSPVDRGTEHDPSCQVRSKCQECEMEMAKFSLIFPDWCYQGGELYRSQFPDFDGDPGETSREFAKVVHAAYRAGIAHLLLWVAASITATDGTPGLDDLAPEEGVTDDLWGRTVHDVVEVYRCAGTGDGRGVQEALNRLDAEVGETGRLFMHAYFAAGLLRTVSAECSPEQRAALMMMATQDVPEIVLARPIEAYLSARVAGAYAGASPDANALITRIVMENRMGGLIYVLSHAMAPYYNEGGGMIGITQEGTMTPVDDTLLDSPNAGLRGAAMALRLTRDIAEKKSDAGGFLREVLNGDRAIPGVMLSTLASSYGHQVVQFMEKLPRDLPPE